MPTFHPLRTTATLAPAEHIVARAENRSDARPVPAGETLIYSDSATHIKALGAFDLERLIARGGMGAVYLARRRDTGKTYALKTMRFDLLASTELVERFRREMSAANLEHPNIMPVLETGEIDGRPFLVMPLAVKCLTAALDEYHDPKAAARMISKVARGVEAAHRTGILHRDLKPGNILLDEHNEPRVADFGLAKLVDDLDTLSLTHTGAILGTPGYMAPEQAFGSKQGIGPAADTWALGVILFELVTGRRPFDGRNREETLEQVRKVEPPTPRSLRPNLDHGIEAIILTCLQKNPADRYPSSGALADELDNWLAGRDVTATSRLRKARWYRWLTGWKRWSAAAIGILVLVTSLAVLAVLAPPNTSSSLVAEAKNAAAIEQELEHARPVRLAGSREPLRWHKWLLERRGTGRLSFAHGYTQLESAGMDLLQVAPITPDGYRLEATLRPIRTAQGDSASYGLFFTHGQFRDAAKYEAFQFLGVSHEPGGVRLQHGFSVRRLFLGHLTAGVLSHSPLLKELPAEVRLQVTVDAGGVTAEGLGRRPHPKTWVEVRDSLDFALGKGLIPGAVRDLPVTGPVGLFVDRSAVEVRSLVLTPLPKR